MQKGSNEDSLKAISIAYLRFFTAFVSIFAPTVKALKGFPRAVRWVYSSSQLSTVTIIVGVIAWLLVFLAATTIAVVSFLNFKGTAEDSLQTSPELELLPVSFYYQEEIELALHSMDDDQLIQTYTNVAQTFMSIGITNIEASRRLVDYAELAQIALNVRGIMLPVDLPSPVEMERSIFDLFTTED